MTDILLALTQVWDAWPWQSAVLNWLLLTVLPVFALWVAARVIAWRHGRRLDRAEAAPGRPRLRSTARAPAGYAAPALVTGAAVVSHAGVRSLPLLWRAIVGGRIAVLNRMIIRARREALLRLEAAAADLGADLVVNVRLSSHGVTDRSGNIRGVEILACGTALRSRSDPAGH